MVRRKRLHQTRKTFPAIKIHGLELPEIGMAFTGLEPDGNQEARSAEWTVLSKEFAIQNGHHPEKPVAEHSEFGILTSEFFSNARSILPAAPAPDRFALLFAPERKRQPEPPPQTEQQRSRM